MEGNWLGKEKMQPKEYSNQVYSLLCTQGSVYLEYMSCPEAATRSITVSWSEIVEDWWVPLKAEEPSKHHRAALGQEQLTEHSSGLFRSVAEGQKAFPRIPNVVPRKGRGAWELAAKTKSILKYSLLLSLGAACYLTAVRPKSLTFLSPAFILLWFWTQSPVSTACLAFTVDCRLNLNSCSSCLCPQGAGIIGLYCHAWLSLFLFFYDWHNNVGFMEA